MRKLPVIVILALTIQGCVEIPTENSITVRSIEDENDFKCEYLGFVSGEGPLGWTTARDPEGAMYKLENEAVKLGANAIRVLNTDSNVTTTVIVADAYKCEFPK